MYVSSKVSVLQQHTSYTKKSSMVINLSVGEAVDVWSKHGSQRLPIRRWCELLLAILSLYNQFNQHQVLACLPTLSATSHVSPMAIDVKDLHVVSLIDRQSLCFYHY